MITDPQRPTEQTSRRRWSLFRFDVLLLAFLVIGWSLIFTTATLGLQNSDEQWLPVGLISNAAADYTVKAANAPRLARINPEIIEAVKRDQFFAATPTPLASLAITPTPTTEPTLTVTTLTSLEIDPGGPYTGDEGSEIPVAAALASSVLNLVPGVVSYVWDLDDDGLYDDYNGAATAVVFYDEGDYIIGVQATDLLGNVGVVTTTVSVSNVPPLVDIGQDITGAEGEAVAFAAVATDPGRDVLLYEWDFGDGDPRVTDTLIPRHTYRDNGNYTVRLIVRDNDGGVTEATLLAQIDNEMPLVDAGPDQTVNEADTIAFSGAATDPGPLDTLTYEWDFNYSGGTFTTDATGPDVSTTYPNGPVNLVAALRVRDKDDGETIDTVNVNVINVPPLITGVSNDGPVGEGLALALTVSASDVGNDRLTYAFDWNDDGSFEEIGAPDTASNTWFNQDDYTVRIRVDDGDGGQVVTTTTVSVLNRPPIAIASTGTGVLEGSAVSFDGSDSNDPGTGDTLTYQWNFGDGNSAAGVNTTHTYGDNGVYSATLTVTDDSGEFSTDAAAVAILNANPTAIAGADTTINEGANISLAYNGTATDLGVDDILSYAWDFDNDGDFDDGLDLSGTYIYPGLDGPADYTIALRVRDDDYPVASEGGEIGEAFNTFKLTITNLPPWNVSAGGSYSGAETEVINLTAVADDAPNDAATLEYAWDLDDNPLSFEAFGKEATHTWNQAGTYTARLRVKDKDGGESFASAQINVGNALPTAEANGPYTSTVGLPLTLTSIGSSDPTGQNLTYRWNFGDGITATTTSITITHTYTDDGIYTATLRVFDGQPGGTDVDTAIVTINNLPPNAVATATPNPVVKGNPLTFDGSGSSDPDDPNLTYQWNFGDGNTANGINVSYSYNSQGSYTAILTVTDDNGAVSTDSIVVNVTNSPPIAVAGPNQAVNEGAPLTFNGSGSSDPNIGDILTYQWNFGDGNTATGVNVSHTYLDGPATFNVTLTVTDNDGATATDTLQVIVTNVTPIANAGGNQSVTEGSSVTFNGSGSSDPGNDPLTYQWNFGDGNTATGVNVSHTYPDGPATFNVTLTVTDGDGGVNTDTMQLTVNNAAPTASASADQTTVAIGETVNFDGSGSTDPGGDTLTYQWNFGDGVTDNSGPLVNHSWLISGTYTIILQVNDGDGGVDIDDAITIIVN